MARFLKACTCFAIMNFFYQEQINNTMLCYWTTFEKSVLAGGKNVNQHFDIADQRF